MKLQKAFDIVSGDVVSLVGAGGKTSTLIALGHELAAAGLRVLATTTTRIGVDQLQLMPFALPATASMGSISMAVDEHHFVFLHGDIRGSKVHGPPLETISRWLDGVASDVLLIEADGARGLPLKAPRPHEPVIPPETTLVVVIASVSVLGQPLDDDHVYNASAIDDRYGFGLGNRVRSPWVGQVLRDEELGLRGVPPGVRVMAFLNQTPPKGQGRNRARLVAQHTLRSPRISGVALGSTRAADPVSEVQRHIGAVVLAAGLSSRMGQSKVLLPWDGRRTVIAHILQQLTLARVPHITVVTGHRSGEVGAVARPIATDVVLNPDFAAGEMLSSLQTGLRALPAHVAAALVVLGDQPRIQPKVVQAVLAAYAEGKGEIVAPSYQMRRGHPILIDRRYWPEILALGPGGAPRDVIDRYQDRIAYVVVDTDSVLKDIDTPEEYRNERRLAGLDR